MLPLPQPCRRAFSPKILFSVANGLQKPRSGLWTSPRTPARGSREAGCREHTCTCSPAPVWLRRVWETTSSHPHLQFQRLTPGPPLFPPSSPRVRAGAHCPRTYLLSPGANKIVSELLSALLRKPSLLPRVYYCLHFFLSLVKMLFKIYSGGSSPPPPMLFL